MALFPLFLAFGLKKVIVSTYQAASGAGAAGMAELKEGIADAVQGDAYLEDDGRFHRWSIMLAVRTSHCPHFPPPPSHSHLATT